MLYSIGLILLVGFFSGRLFNKIKLPSLLAFILIGILMGPNAFHLIDSKLLSISEELRQFALVVILTRAGLSLNIEDLKKVGSSAFLMCFLPAVLEIIGVISLAPILLGISLLDAAIVGSIVAAVSPAIVVPRMIRLMEEEYGTEKRIPQFILAGASVDDIIVIVLFSFFTGIAATKVISPLSLLGVPVSISFGILLGYLVGKGLILFFQKNNFRTTIQVLILLGLSFCLLELQKRLSQIIPISSLLAIMTMSMYLKQKDSSLAKLLEKKYNSLWIFAEIFLFVMVGAAVNIQYAMKAGIVIFILVLSALLFRMIGVFLSLSKADLNWKELLFSMLAYSPKATVQAAIGAIPLSMGLEIGETALTVAVLSILITAPLGAISMDLFYDILLEKKHK